ncbi:MAG: hypothetical protein PHY23_05440, partial [Oscillospiraceae bacterium]|nr:hypothetical protein [Oscillospiraceae bacterium]
SPHAAGWRVQFERPEIRGTPVNFKGERADTLLKTESLSILTIARKPSGIDRQAFRRGGVQSSFHPCRTALAFFGGALIH